MKVQKTTIIFKKIVLLGLFISQAPLFAVPAALKAPTYKTAYAPQITSQPTSVVACFNESATFKVVAQGTEVTYQWEKNGTVLTNNSSVSGATTATLTLSSVNEDDAAAYRCLVTNTTGSVYTNSAYLNSAITATTANATCVGQASGISVTAVGNSPAYQWYDNGKSSTITADAKPISGATSATYSPSVATAGTHYYFVKVYPAGNECAAKTSDVIAFSTDFATAGTVVGNQTVCAGNVAIVSVSGSAGAIQWQQSTDNGATWNNVTDTEARTSTLVVENIPVTTLYRVTTTSGGCTAQSDFVTVTVKETNVWTGASDIYWNNSANWDCGSVPSIYTIALIPAGIQNQPKITGEIANAKSLVIENGAAVTVATKATLNVVNAINVNTGGQLLVQDNAALLQQTNAVNTGVITAVKNSNDLFRLDYTLWSSPVAGQQLLAFSPNTLPNRFYEYKYDFDSGTNIYAERYFPVDPTANFNIAKPYLIRMPNADATPGYNEGTAKLTFQGTFTGVPHNGTVTKSLSMQGNRFTAVGNPYPSPISVLDFFSANNSAISNSSAIYFWRKTNNNEETSYAMLTLAGYTANPAPGGGAEQAAFYADENSAEWTIAQGQGFFVQAAAGTSNPNATFTNSMRRAADKSGKQGFFRPSATPPSRLWINLIGQNGASQAAIAYMDGATTGIDYGYDGAQLNKDGIASIYSIAEKTDLGIQARPAFTDTDVVALGYVAKTAGEYTLSIDHVDGLFKDGQEIFIKDTALGLLHNFKDGAYTFATDAGTNNDRLQVVYKTAEALDANNPALTANNVVIYKDGNTININTGSITMNAITVFDIAGRKLYSNSNMNVSESTVSGITARNQLLIVEVSTEKGNVSKKIIF
jgi:hypothetical protein